MLRVGSVDRWRDEFVAMANDFAADLGGYCSATFTKNHYNLRRIFAVLRYEQLIIVVTQPYLEIS